jgi:hypothetical protein
MKAWFAPVFWYWPQEIDRVHGFSALACRLQTQSRWTISPAVIGSAAIEIPQMVPILALLIATGLLATDVLGVVMARMM